MLENTNIWIVITIFTITLEWIILNRLVSYTNGIKVYNIKTNIVLSIIILFSIVINLMDIFPNCRIIICIFITILFCKNIYNKNILQAASISLLYWMILLGMDAISMSLTVWANSLNSMDTLMNQNIYRFQSIFISKCMLIIASNLYCTPNLNIDISEIDISYMIIPIITNITSFFVIYKYLIEIKPLDNILNNKEVLMWSILLLLSNVSLIFSIRKTIIDNKLIAEANLIKKTMEMKYYHYENIQKDQVKLRQLRHDIKNHIACIKGVTQSKYDATEYISSIENEINRHDSNFHTGNIILDIILNEKNKVCKESNIKCLIDISNFEKCDFIDKMDVCSIFSNILDNAIEACNKINSLKKEIVLRGTIINDFFVIRIENTKQNKINKKQNIIKTDKKDTHLHGLGLKSVKDSVSKYDGEVSINYSENRFVVNIFIPLEPK